MPLEARPPEYEITQASPEIRVVKPVPLFPPEIETQHDMIVLDVFNVAQFQTKSRAGAAFQSYCKAPFLNKRSSVVRGYCVCKAARGPSAYISC